MATCNIRYCPYCGKRLPELKKDVVICICGGIFQATESGWLSTNDEDVLETICPIGENVQNV